MILAARLALNFAMAAFSDPVDPNAKFKLKFSSPRVRDTRRNLLTAVADTLRLGIG